MESGQFSTVHWEHSVQTDYKGHAIARSKKEFTLV